jgi:hypothetical protein
VLFLDAIVVGAVAWSFASLSISILSFVFSCISGSVDAEKEGSVGPVFYDLTLRLVFQEASSLGYPKNSVVGH